MVIIKANKPESYDGRRDALAVNTWLYQVEMYLNVVQMNNPQQIIDENTKVSVASTFLSGHAAQWWFMIVQSGQVPAHWEEFVACVRNEFIAQDSVRRARDRLRSLFQKASVSSYLNQFRNIIIAIPGMNEGEKLDRFCAGLKPQVRLEVLKANPETLNEASQIALNVDNALTGVGMFNPGGFGRYGANAMAAAAPQPMDIGNVEGQAHYRGKAFKPKRKGKRNEDEQRRRDMANNACFLCHKRGCRPWRHSDGERERLNANNVHIDGDGDQISDSESEN